jgi:hypothetical protein
MANKKQRKITKAEKADNRYNVFKLVMLFPVGVYRSVLRVNELTSYYICRFVVCLLFV